MCMGGRYLLIGHCFFTRLVALKRTVLFVVFLIIRYMKYCFALSC